MRNLFFNGKERIARFWKNRGLIQKRKKEKLRPVPPVGMISFLKKEKGKDL